jgi:hypothetical protein
MLLRPIEIITIFNEKHKPLILMSFNNLSNDFQFF